LGFVGDPKFELGTWNAREACLSVRSTLQEGLSIHRMGGLNRYGEPFFGVGSMVQSEVVPVKELLEKFREYGLKLLEGLRGIGCKKPVIGHHQDLIGLESNPLQLRFLLQEPAGLESGPENRLDVVP